MSASRIAQRGGLLATYGTFSYARIRTADDIALEAAKVGKEAALFYLGSRTGIARAAAARGEQRLFFAERESDIMRVLPENLYGPAFRSTLQSGADKDLTMRQVLKAQETVARGLQKLDPTKLTAKELFQIKTESFSNKQLRQYQKIFTQEGVVVGGSAATQQQLLKTFTQYKSIVPKTRDAVGAKIIQKSLPVVTTKAKVPGDLDVFVPDAKIGSPALSFLKLSKGFDVKPISALKDFYGFKPQIVTTPKGLKVVGIGTQYVKALQGTTNLGQADSGLKYYLDIVTTYF